MRDLATTENPPPNRQSQEIAGPESSAKPGVDLQLPIYSTAIFKLLSVYPPLIKNFFSFRQFQTNFFCLCILLLGTSLQDLPTYLPRFGRSRQVHASPTIIALNRVETDYRRCSVDPACRAGPGRSPLLHSWHWLEWSYRVESNHLRFDSFLCARPPLVFRFLRLLDTFVPLVPGSQAFASSVVESLRSVQFQQTPDKHLVHDFFRFNRPYPTVLSCLASTFTKHTKQPPPGKRLDLCVSSLRCELSRASHRPHELELRLPFVLDLGNPFELNSPNYS